MTFNNNFMPLVGPWKEIKVGTTTYTEFPDSFGPMACTECGTLTRWYSQEKHRLFGGPFNRRPVCLHHIATHATAELEKARQDLDTARREVVKLADQRQEVARLQDSNDQFRKLVDRLVKVAGARNASVLDTRIGVLVDAEKKLLKIADFLGAPRGTLEKHTNEELTAENESLKADIEALKRQIAEKRHEDIVRADILSDVFGKLPAIVDSLEFMIEQYQSTPAGRGFGYAPADHIHVKMGRDLIQRIASFLKKPVPPTSRELVDRLRNVNPFIGDPAEPNSLKRRP